MNYVYLQCDCRYNKWLLNKIGNRYAIEYTIAKCNQISETVAGVYKCEENKLLIDILDKNGITLYLSNEENVNKRFLNIVTKLNADIIVRVGGDQVLMDTDATNNIIRDMEDKEYKFFYDESSRGILPDIVKADCLRDYLSELSDAKRYFHVLLKKPEIKRYYTSFPLLSPFDFRLNSNGSFRVCKNVIENNLNIYDISMRMLSHLTHKNSYLAQTGLLESWIIPLEYADFYYEENGTVNPWLGRTIVDLIKGHLSKNLKVFEWGMGNSTLFWSKYVQTVVSVEHNKEWYEKMRMIVPENVECRYRELEYGGKYCEEVLNTKDMYDIIMIDGRDRVRCAKNAMQKLKSGGVIVWDDTDRESYKNGFDYLKSQGFKQLELNSVGYGEPIGYSLFTSIFYKSINILEL